MHVSLHKVFSGVHQVTISNGTAWSVFADWSVLVTSQVCSTNVIESIVVCVCVSVLEEIQASTLVKNKSSNT